MKCSDISDESVLRLLAKHQGVWATWGQSYCGTPTVRDAMPLGTPEKLQVAKMKRLIARGFVEGCDCGCRGDFEITDAGLALISEPRTAPMICPPRKGRP